MTNDEFNMGKEQEVLDLSPWVVLNMNEIAKLIAYNLCNTEYELKQEFIDEDINDYLSYLHEYIFNKVIDEIEKNGKVVL